MSDSTRLSQIETLWSVVRRAHGDQTTDVHRAREELVDRYGGAVRRYLLGALRDPDAVDDVYQDFHVKFLRGEFHNADPEKGEFRGFLKTVLRRLIADHYNRRNRSRTVPLQQDFPAHEDPPAFDDEAFTRCWRSELLDSAWEALKENDRKSEKSFYTVLRASVDHSELRSQELAPIVGELLGRTITADNLRKLVSRARLQFSELLLNLVEQSLDGASREALDDELIDLELFKYCRSALAQRS